MHSFLRSLFSRICAGADITILLSFYIFMCNTQSSVVKLTDPDHAASRLNFMNNCFCPKELVI